MKNLTDKTDDQEQCAHVIAGERFCSWFYANHSGTFQHDFQRPPEVKAEDECEICGDAVCRGVTLVWALVKINSDPVAKGRKVCIRCADNAPAIALRQ